VQACATVAQPAAITTMHTANPILRTRALSPATAGAAATPARAGVEAGREPVMTLAGVLGKVAVLLVLVVLSTLAVWRNVYYMPLSAEGWGTLGCGIGMVFGVLIVLRPTWAGVLAPVVAMCVGLTVGGMSAYIERIGGGPVGIAVVASPIAMVVLLWMYRAGIVHPRERTRAVSNVVTGGIVLLFLLSFVLQPWVIGVPVLAFSPAGAVLCAIVLAVAGLNLVLDVGAVRASARAGAPVELEWYAAFALLVSLVWMYPEMVRMLARAYSRYVHM
jgi:uncharacterized YccA/Bax inhibitor family protein